MAPRLTFGRGPVVTVIIAVPHDQPRGIDWSRGTANENGRTEDTNDRNEP